MGDQASAADAQMFDIKNYDLQDLLDIDVNAYLNRSDCQSDRSRAAKEVQRYICLE